MCIRDSVYAGRPSAPAIRRADDLPAAMDRSLQDPHRHDPCLLYTSPSPRDRTRSRMPSSA